MYIRYQFKSRLSHLKLFFNFVLSLKTFFRDFIENLLLVGFTVQFYSTSLSFCVSTSPSSSSSSSSTTAFAPRSPLPTMKTFLITKTYLLLHLLFINPFAATKPPSLTQHHRIHSFITTNNSKQASEQATSLFIFNLLTYH